MTQDTLVANNVPILHSIFRGGRSWNISATLITNMAPDEFVITTDSTTQPHFTTLSADDYGAISELIEWLAKGHKYDRIDMTYIINFDHNRTQHRARFRCMIKAQHFRR